MRIKRTTFRLLGTLALVLLFGLATATAAFAVTPTISNLAPNAKAAGSLAFTMTVTGTGFDAAATVKWGATALTTTFVSSISLTAAVPAGLVAAGPATASITVVNPGPATSGSSTFTITQPAVASILPVTAANTATAQAFTLTGTDLLGLDSPSVLLEKGEVIVTATSVTAANATTMSGAFDLSAPITAPPGVYDVRLKYGATGSVLLAGAFTVTGPTVTSITPVVAVNDNGAVVFTLTGADLLGLTTPVVRFKGTGTNAATTLTADSLVMPAGGATMSGLVNLTSPAPAPAGVYDVVLTYGTSSAVKLAAAFTISNAIPLITTISPTTVYAGSTQPLVLTVNGSGFVTALVAAEISKVSVGGRATTNTTFVSATRLTVPLTAADIAVAGPVPITVVNPAPGGGTSNAVNLTVANDTAAPTTTISGADSAWHKLPVALTVGAIDSQSGVKTTKYSINSAAPIVLTGSIITVPAPAGGSGDGTKTVRAYSLDFCGNIEDPGSTVTVKIDTMGPKTTAKVASPVKAGTRVKFTYRANDISPTCKIVLKIKRKGGTSVKRAYDLGSKQSNKTLSYTVNPGLSAGTWVLYVHATDLAGNKQSEMGQATFKVK